MRKFMKWHFAFLLSLSGFAQAEAPKAFAVPAGSEILDVQNGYVLLRQDRKNILLADTGVDRKFLMLEGEANRLAGAKVSQSGKRLLAFFLSDQDSGYFQLYELPSGRLLIKSASIDRLQGAFWGSDCHYYVHTRQAENGGALKVYSDTTNSNCNAKAAATGPKAPEGESPSYIWVDEHQNIWSFYKNGSRSLLNWVGRGNFNGFQSSQSPYVWYQEPSYKGVLLQGDVKLKKSQPLVPVIAYVARHDQPHVFAIIEDDIVELSLKRDFSVSRRKIGKMKGATRLFWDAKTSRLLVENAQNRYFFLKH